MEQAKFLKFLALRDEEEQEVEIANTVEDKVAAAIPDGFLQRPKRKFQSQKMEIKLELVSVSWYKGRCQPPKRVRKMAQMGYLSYFCLQVFCVVLQV